jgi:hypothetical protein
MSTMPPMPPGMPPGPGGPPEDQPEAPASAVGSGTHSPSDSMTRYDKERDIFHCSFGIPSPALAIMDPEREVVVRVERNTFRVVGFSIPNFTAWHEKHADAEGHFEIDPPLPDVWPMDQTDMSGAAGSYAW